MKNNHSLRGYVKGALAAAALLAVPVCAAWATPIMDGAIDADYGAPIATSAKDNLLIDAVDSINDNTATASPSPKSFDVTNMYVTNSADALFIYVQLPYLDLSRIYGDWGIVMHLGGANDAIVRTGSIQDSYGAPVYFSHTLAPNAEIKSNCLSDSPSSDGNNGWGYVNTTKADGSGWDFPTGNIFLSDRKETAAGIIHGYGAQGAEIVYKAGDGTNGGIEMKIPLSLFTTSGVLTAPAVGDSLKLQWYGTTRNTSNGHDRGPIDCVPFESASRLAPGTSDFYPWGGYISEYASFTIKAPTSFDVTSGAYVDLTHASITFSDNVGTGADTPANFVITDALNGSVIAVTTSAIDSSNAKKVNLTTASMKYGHKYNVTVSNVKSTGGSAVGASNSTSIQAPVQVRFRLSDPNNIVGTQGIDPATTQPGQITVTGSFNNWAANGDGTINPAEVLVNPVTGETNTYQSDVVLLNPGTIYYKYRIPVLLCSTGCYAWDTLNYGGDPNRRVVLPANDENIIQTLDLAVNTSTPGSPVAVTFTLVDNENRAAGRQVQIAGSFNGWNSDPTSGLVMTAVAGKKNTYSATAQINGGYIEYKYVLKPDPVNDPNNTLWDVFGGNNLYSTILGAGTPLAQTITDVIGTASYVRALRVAAGLEAGPLTSDSAFASLDAVVDGKITIADAVKLVKP